MPDPITSKYKRNKYLVPRSFRCSPEVDKLLDEYADEKGCTKTFLIQDIIHSWYVRQMARRKAE